LPQGRDLDHAEQLTVRSAAILAAAAIALAGCQQSSVPAGAAEANQPAAATARSAPAEHPAPSAAADAVMHDTGALPPPGGLRFVGPWASDVKNCSTAAWRFTDTSLRTPAGSHCTFSKVTAVPGGYDIAASCTAEAPAKADTLKIRFAESARAMLFESETIADAGLVYCGREG
jgi:hypothetical protein